MCLVGLGPISRRHGIRADLCPDENTGVLVSEDLSVPIGDAPLWDGAVQFYRLMTGGASSVTTTLEGYETT
jgi:hypothetical protein